MRWRRSDRTGDMMGNGLPPCRSACGPQLPGQARAQAPAARWLIAHVCCAPPAMGGISARHARPADFAHAHPQDTAPSNVDFDSEFVVTTAALAPGPGTVRAWSVCAPCVCSCSPAWCGRTGSTFASESRCPAGLWLGCRLRGAVTGCPPTTMHVGPAARHGTRAQSASVRS